MRLIIPTTTPCDICHSEKIRPAPAGGMTEMRNAGYYMWQHFNLQTPQTSRVKINLQSLPKSCILLPKAGEELQLPGALNQQRDNTNFKWIGDFKRSERK